MSSFDKSGSKKAYTNKKILKSAEDNTPVKNTVENTCKNGTYSPLL